MFSFGKHHSLHESMRKYVTSSWLLQILSLLGKSWSVISEDVNFPESSESLRKSFCCFVVLVHICRGYQSALLCHRTGEKKPFFFPLAFIATCFRHFQQRFSRVSFLNLRTTARRVLQSLLSCFKSHHHLWLECRESRDVSKIGLVIPTNKTSPSFCYPSRNGNSRQPNKLLLHKRESTAVFPFRK